MQKELFIDLETRNAAHDLEEDGLDWYSRTAEITMAGWAIDDDPVQLWNLDTSIPSRLLNALNDPSYLLVAFYATFERTLLHRSYGIWLPYERWRDVRVLARSWSLPGSLEKASEVLKLTDDDRKLDGGKLIDLFCKPARHKEEHTLFGTLGKFNDAASHPEQWAQFEEYCKRDVHAERVIWRMLNASPLPMSEWEGWFLDQKINDTGIPVNRKMAENALWLAQREQLELLDKLKEITGLENPNSDTQMKEWARARGYRPNSLLKQYLQAELDDKKSKMTDECRMVLKIRQQERMSSFKKLERLLRVLGPDDMLRYQFQYGGAARTMRWSGADVQTQNLPRPIKAVEKDYQKAVDLIMKRDYDTIKADYPSVISMVASSLRMTFQAPDGQKISICDLNAIENRVLGFLARCPAILKVFELGRDPYLAFAVYLFSMTYEELLAEYEAGNKEKRQLAKAPVLGGGYGLGGGELKKNQFGDWVRTGLWGYSKNVCMVDMPQEMAHKAVKILRDSWKEVTYYWTDLEEAFKQVVKFGGTINVGEVTWSRYDKRWVPCAKIVPGTVLKFDLITLENGISALHIQLPSGRCLHYLNPEIVEEPFTYKDKKTGKPKQAIGDVLYYSGIEHSSTQDEEGKQIRKTTKWARAKTYGGKLTENVVQAFSRDLLLNAMKLADKTGLRLFGTFHDELTALSPDDPFGLGVNDLKYCMQASPSWAPTMPLGAEGFESKFYRKG